MDVAMNVSARLRQLLAFGLAALLHVGLAMIPLPRSAENPARTGIEPAALSVEVEVIPPVPVPRGGAAQPEIAAEKAAQPVQSRARSARATRVAQATRVDDRHGQRVFAAQSGAPRAHVEVEPAEPYPDDDSARGLRPMSLDLSDHAAVPGLDALSGHVPAKPGASAAGLTRPGVERIDRHAYALRVRGLVEARKRYPARARRLGQEGEVSVRVRIAPDGRLLGQPRVTASSGAEALDREALRMVRQASPFPPSGAATAIQLAVPVRFALDER
jgi:protein TonB